MNPRHDGLVPGNEVILARLEALHDDVADIKADTAEVKQQVKLTNGRVTRLELWQARLDGARAAVNWTVVTGVAFASLLMGAAGVIAGVVIK